MPIVPIEKNKVGLATTTDAKFRAPDYSGSGLEALGAGLVHLGAGLEERRRRAAEAIAAAMLDDRHQGNIDDVAVKKAYVDYSDGSHEALHGDDGLFNQPGAVAHAAFPGVVETLVDHHDKALSKLDDVQRATLAPVLNERLRSDVGRAADYVRQQGAAEQKRRSVQLQKAAARDAVNHADDPDLFDHHLATGEKTIRQQAKIDSVGDRLLDKQIADYRSGVHADTIDALTQRDPVHAAGWYARNGDTLNRRDKLRVEAKLGQAQADARAVADVAAGSDASEPTSAPANPHAGNDALLLLKMQGITPMMDQTELPSLMQRYGNDPAKAWAAFEAGPETVDRLIAQRGDDWYGGLGDDARRFVDGNMKFLRAAHSVGAELEDPQAVVARIAAQDWSNARTAGAMRALGYRSDRSAIGGIDPVNGRMLPADFVTAPGRRADIMQPIALEGGAAQQAQIPTLKASSAGPELPADVLELPSRQPQDIEARMDRLADALAPEPTSPLFRPVKSGVVGKDMILAAPVSSGDRYRLSGEDIQATPDIRAAAARAAALVQVRTGQDEKVAYGYRMPDGSIDVRLAVVQPTHQRRSDGAHTAPSGPGIPIFCIHGHIDDRSDGMVDDPSANKGFGDTYELHRHHIPVATVINGVIGWHEMRKGQLLFTYPIGTQTDDQEDKIKTNLSTSQGFFMKPK